MKHWQEAQEEERAKSGTNMVVAHEGNVVLVGSVKRGWRIVTPDLILHAQTPQAVELLLEEWGIAPLGWS